MFLKCLYFSWKGREREKEWASARCCDLTICKVCSQSFYICGGLFCDPGCHLDSLENVLCALKENVRSTAVGWKDLNISVLISMYINVYIKANIYLCISEYIWSNDTLDLCFRTYFLPWPYTYCHEWSLKVVYNHGICMYTFNHVCD